MSLLTDTIQTVNYATENKLSENTKLAQLVKRLERLFDFSDSSVPISEMVEQLRAITRLYENFQNNNIAADKLNTLDKILETLEEYIQKYQEFFPNEILQELKEIEINTKATQKIIKANYLLNKAGEENEANLIQMFYLGWSEFSQVVDKYVQYLPIELVETLQKTSQKIILNDAFKNNTNNLMMDIYNIAKVILWDISKYKEHKVEKKFETLDDLWEYWDDNFDSEEMAETSEIVMEAIDETRERQGRAKLFS